MRSWQRELGGPGSKLNGRTIGGVILVLAIAPSIGYPDSLQPPIIPGYLISPRSQERATEGSEPMGRLNSEADAPHKDSHSFEGSDFNEDRPPPYVILLGRKNRDLANPSRFIQPDQQKDTWLRFYPRNLEYFLKEGAVSKKSPAIKYLILRTLGAKPYKQWDTLPGSTYPMLQVESSTGQLLNRLDGTITGLRASSDGALDLFIGDDGEIALRHTPMELKIITLEGDYRITVRRNDLNSRWLD